MDNDQRKWLYSMIENELDREPFHGKIELNIQNSQIITVNVTRGKRPPKK